MKTIVVNLDTFALKANVIIFDNEDLNNSINCSVPYHSFTQVAGIIDEHDVHRVILKGNQKFAQYYKDELEATLLTNYSKRKVEIVID